MLIRRRPSVATLVAVIVTLAVGSQAGLAAHSSQQGRAPQAVSSVEVTATDASSVTIGWPGSSNRDSVVAYGIYLNGSLVATQTADKLTRWRDRQLLSYTIQGLACGTGYTVGVDAVDRDNDRSPVTTTTVSTAACPDTSAPSAPTGMRQVAATENSVMLAWTPSSDNVGVVEYGLYASGVRVSTVTSANATITNLVCGKSYLIAIDAADAAGNRSPQVSSFFRTSTCPSTNQPPSTPTGLKVTAATTTGVSLAWTASTDDVAVAGYGLYVAGQRTGDTTKTSAAFTGLQCGTTYTLGVDAYDSAGKRSTVAELTAATSPCAPPPASSTSSITQTITDGATLSGPVTWRAVFDANGDKVPDDPGSVAFLVDGKLVLTEQSMPFGDTAGFWSSTSVTNGRHTFEVRAVNNTGTVVATSTISASVSNSTSVTGDTTAPSVPGNLRVVSASATSVTVAWNASTDNVGVAGYGLYRGSSQTGQTQQLTATYGGLSCGTAYQVGVDAYDAAGNRSSRADLAVTTSPCPDSQPPTAPTNVTVSTRTTTSIALTWAPSTDNVGVAGYGVYNGADLVDTTTGTTGIVSGLTCGTSYTLSVDAFDATGNSSPKTAIMVSTLACADTSAPTVTATSPTNGSTVSGTVTAAVNATDNVGVTKVEFLRDGVMYGQDTTAPYSTTLDTKTVTNGSHTLGARAYDAAGNMGTAPNVTVTVNNAAPTSNCPVSTPHVPGGPDGNGGCWPGVDNTGPNAAASSMSAYTGSCTISVANTVIDSKVVNCRTIVVAASGFVLKNSYLNGGIVQSGGNPSFTVQDSFIDSGVQYPACSDGTCSAGKYACGDPNNQTTDCGITGTNFTILRTEIINSNRAAYCEAPGPCLIQDNYFHGTNLWPDKSNLAHASSVREEQNLTLRHNSLHCSYTGPFVNDEIGCSADLTGYPDFTPIKNNTVDRNLFVAAPGAAYCAYGGGTAAKPYSGDPTNATYQVFTNNVFQRGANGKCAAYGAITDFQTGRTGNIWSNNTWDNGAVVNPG